MSDPQTQYAVAKSPDAIDLIELTLVVWRTRRLVYVCVASMVVLALLYLHIATYTYTAQMVVVPIQGQSSSLTSKLGGLSGLANMAGVSLPQDQGGSQFQFYVEGLHSRVAADALAANIDLMRVLYPNEWDEQAQGWRRPTGPIRLIVTVAKAIVGLPDVPWQPPNGAKLEKYIEDNVRVVEETKKPLVTVFFDHKDPAFAVAFLRALDRAVDNQLRQKALYRSSQNIAYLSGKLKSVTLAEQREAIMQALSEQERSAMMANSTASFAAETFGPPYQSYRPTKPQPLIVLGGGAIAGLLIGIILVFFAPAHWVERFEYVSRGHRRHSAMTADRDEAQGTYMSAGNSDSVPPMV